ncbi:MAG TPA: hypothetical protein VFS40_09845 [Gemmatimonadales bacterium]|nr:hypothetical protein [Gemmatimonadales bacterium]
MSARRRATAAGAALALLCAALAPRTPLAAQRVQPAAQSAMDRAFDFERRGAYAEAAESYRAALAEQPGNLAALLGFERALVPLGRGAEVIPAARAALAAGPPGPQVYAVLVRAFTAAGATDSTRATAERWAKLDAKSEAPWREWIQAAAQRRDFATAGAALRLARERLGRPDALAAEAAQLTAHQGDVAGAVREWVVAVTRRPEDLPAAVRVLADGATTPAQRADLLRALQREPVPEARLLEAGLRARFGEPLAGFQALRVVLSGDGATATRQLQFFAEQLRMLDGPEARRALGQTLEALAERQSGTEARETRLQAAQAYAAGGDRVGSRRLLARVDAQAGAPALGGDATVTLVTTLLDAGKVDEAERKLGQSAASMDADTRLGLQRRLALAWGLEGRFDHADSLVAADSSVEGLAAAGRVRLYRGDVAGAVARLRDAGPYAGSRDQATARAALLATLQTVRQPSLPALGEAFRTLDGGDTARAIPAFERAAKGLPPAEGGAALQLLAGRLAASAGRPADAERLLRAAAADSSPVTGPAAELELGRLLLASGRRDAAVQQLEHLILTYPQSALVPQARRALDEARGAVPPRGAAGR